MLEICSISKAYGAHRALDNVSFTAEEGEVIGLVGCNGAGKSTLMNILTGYIAATSGEVRLDGVSMADQPAACKRRMGYLPEIPPLYGEMTVLESLTFAAQIKGIPARKIPQECRRVMGLAQILDHAPRLVEHLSKGYRQRVGLAQALLGDPALLVLDEPSAGLDPVQIAELREVIRQVSPGRMVLISSHILQEISDAASRIVMIDHGRILCQGKLSELLAGAGRLRLRTADRPNLTEALEALPEIDRAERLSSCEKGCAELALYGRDEAAVRRAAGECLAGLGCPVYLMAPEQAALESLFMAERARAEQKEAAD